MPTISMLICHRLIANKHVELALSTVPLLRVHLNALIELLSCLQAIHQVYDDEIDVTAICRPRLVVTGLLGRPLFDVTKEQLEYLISIIFMG